MARYSFGLTLDAWVFDIAADGVTPALVAGSTVTCWTAQTAGDQITDLLAADGSTAIDHITSADGTGTLPIGQLPLWFGPDGVTDMWLSADGGTRVHIVANDAVGTLSDAVGTLSDEADDLENQAANNSALLAMAALVWTPDDTGTWQPRPDIAGDRTVLWIGPTSPPVGGTPAYMLDGTDIWFATSGT